MKCKHCGAELKQLFYADSLFCPNGCDKKPEVSDETPIQISKNDIQGLNKGDAVRMIKDVGKLKIGDILYYVRRNMFDNEYEIWLAFEKESALKNKAHLWVRPDRIEVVE